MPGQSHPPFDQFRQTLVDINNRLAALERTQQMVITDATKTHGDPNHGYAVVVIGNLTPICGFTAPSFGIASYKTGAWVQL